MNTMLSIPSTISIAESVSRLIRFALVNRSLMSLMSILGFR